MVPPLLMFSICSFRSEIMDRWGKWRNICNSISGYHSKILIDENITVEKLYIFPKVLNMMIVMENRDHYSPVFIDQNS